MSIFREIGIRDGKDRQGEEFLYNLAACYMHAERRLERLLAKHGLTPVKMNALLIVLHIGKKEGVSQGDIARRMIVSAGNITRLVDRLDKEGLVTRKALAGDRRVKRIVATAKAGQMLDAAWPAYKKAVNQMAASISKDIGTGVRILNQFRTTLSQTVSEA